MIRMIKSLFFLPQTLFLSPMHLTMLNSHLPSESKRGGKAQISGLVISGFSLIDIGEERAMDALLVLMLLRRRSTWGGRRPEGSEG